MRVGGVKMLKVKGQGFGDSQAGAVEQLREGQVAGEQGRVGRIFGVRARAFPSNGLGLVHI